MGVFEWHPKGLSSSERLEKKERKGKRKKGKEREGRKKGKKDTSILSLRLTSTKTNYR